MRKLSKRFLALLMAMVMALSCTAVASAAKVEEPLSEPVSMVYSADNSDSGIVPLSRSYVNVTGEGNYNGQTITRSFTIPYNQKLRIRFGIVGTAHLTIQLRTSWGFKSNLFDGDYTDYSMDKISGECAEGIKVTCTLTFKSNYASYYLFVDEV